MDAGRTEGGDHAAVGTERKRSGPCPRITGRGCGPTYAACRARRHAPHRILTGRSSIGGNSPAPAGSQAPERIAKPRVTSERRRNLGCAVKIEAAPGVTDKGLRGDTRGGEPAKPAAAQRLELRLPAEHEQRRRPRVPLADEVRVQAKRYPMPGPIPGGTCPCSLPGSVRQGECLGGVTEGCLGGLGTASFATDDTATARGRGSRSRKPWPPGHRAQPDPAHLRPSAPVGAGSTARSTGRCSATLTAAEPSPSQPAATAP